ncbi:unannotated protein [freshwater metagenome]|uniref:Unannotated protein n=1 Tax=freshwater metagenome TaxID=449393 RepID=A0A6J6G5K9_9ZZZZ|nr:hypothetical protein [Actinomycetota bacterium]
MAGSVRRRRLLGVVLLLLIGAGAVFLAASGSGGAAPESSAPEISVEESTTTAVPETTTTTMRRDIPGSQLAPGPASIYVLGDSVTLGAKLPMPTALAGWELVFDSKESRRIDQGIDIVQAKDGLVGRVLVVHLCTNWGGDDFGAAAARLMSSLADVDRVIWVTCVPWIPAVGAADEAIRALPSLYPNVVVADWAVVATTPGFTYDDGLHLRTEGAEGFAAMIAAAAGPPPLPV